MNPYRQIALEHLSVKELEGVISELKQKHNKLEVLTEQQKKLNALKGRLLSRINY